MEDGHNSKVELAGLDMGHRKNIFFFFFVLKQLGGWFVLTDMGRQNDAQNLGEKDQEFHFYMLNLKFLPSQQVEIF